MSADIRGHEALHHHLCTDTKHSFFKLSGARSACPVPCCVVQPAPFLAVWSNLPRSLLCGPACPVPCCVLQPAPFLAVWSSLPRSLLCGPTCPVPCCVVQPAPFLAVWSSLPHSLLCGPACPVPCCVVQPAPFLAVWSNLPRSLLYGPKSAVYSLRAVILKKQEHPTQQHVNYFECFISNTSQFFLYDMRVLFRFGVARYLFA